MAVEVEKLTQIPLKALQEKSRIILSKLNREMMLLSDDNNFRDWRGVLHFAEIDKEFKDSLRGTTTGRDFMYEIITRWSDSSNCKHCNFKSLIEILQKIDRYDIYDDILESLQNDARIFHEKGLQLVQNDFKVVPTITSDDRQRANLGLKLFIYDAIILYAETDARDEELAGRIYEYLRSKKYRICTRNDLIGGLSLEFNACMDLITKRCRRVIVIISQALQESSVDKFLTDFTHDFDIRNNKQKIVPVQREFVKEPSQNLAILFHLKFYKHGTGLFDFWKKLEEAVAYYPSLEASLETDEYEYTPVTDLEISHAQGVPSRNNVPAIKGSTVTESDFIPMFVKDFNDQKEEKSSLKGGLVPLKSQNGFLKTNGIHSTEENYAKAVESAPSPPNDSLSENSSNITSESLHNSQKTVKKKSYAKKLKLLKKECKEMIKKTFKNSDKKKIAVAESAD